MEIPELGEVAIDRHLVEIVHGNSWIKRKGITGWTKNPRGVHEERRGALEVLPRAVDQLRQQPPPWSRMRASRLCFVAGSTQLNRFDRQFLIAVPRQQVTDEDSIRKFEGTWPH
jgi:hypothetical protein